METTGTGKEKNTKWTEENYYKKKTKKCLVDGSLT